MRSTWAMKHAHVPLGKYLLDIVHCRSGAANILTVTSVGLNGGECKRAVERTVWARPPFAFLGGHLPRNVMFLVYDRSRTQPHPRRETLMSCECLFVRHRVLVEQNRARPPGGVKRRQGDGNRTIQRVSFAGTGISRGGDAFRVQRCFLEYFEETW